MAEKYLEFEQDGVKYNLYDMPDGFVIKGDVDLGFMCLTELPDLSKVIVEGSLFCPNNWLTSLKGAPQEVKGDFICGDNALITLEGAPKKVGRSFYCNNNKLTSLAGAPQEVGGSFMCRDNLLTTLKGGPQKVGGTFTCTNNRLVSLEGAPQIVENNFYCEGNPLKNLLFAPVADPKGRIYCDKELGSKYGVYDSTFKGDCTTGGIVYKTLLDSPVYRGEVSKLNIMLKKQEENSVGQKKALSWYENYKRGAKPKSEGRE